MTSDQTLGHLENMIDTSHVRVQEKLSQVLKYL